MAAGRRKQGYEFLEWQLDGQEYKFNEPVSKSITLQAKWLALHKVTFDLQGGKAGL